MPLFIDKHYTSYVPVHISILKKHFVWVGDLVICQLHDTSKNHHSLI